MQGDEGRTKSAVVREPMDSKSHGGECLDSAGVLAAAIAASTDPARRPEASREEPQKTVAAVVYRAVVHGGLDDVNIVSGRRRRSRRCSLVDDLRRLLVRRLLVNRSGRLVGHWGLVAHLCLVSLLVGIVVSHL